MPRSTTVRLSALALASAALLSACGGDKPTAAPLTAAANTPTSTATDTPTDEPTTGSAKLSGENLLGWKDYSALGIKSLTVRWSSKPAQAPMSRCQTGDLRDAGGRTALWQSTSETKGDVLAGQQVGSFQSKEAAESAFGHIAEWNKDCTSLQQESADVDVAGDADATYWKRTLDDKTGEIVALVRIGKRVSIIVANGKAEAVAQLDPEAIVAASAVKLG